jgi:CHASE2 domain-containing sensor protein
MKGRRLDLLELCFAILLIVGAIWVVHYLESNYKFLDWRLQFHQNIHTWAAERRGKPLKDQNTIVVLIGDNEFWKGDYEGRTPLNESVLAKLVESVTKLKPRVIALDFNFSGLTRDGSMIESPKYLKDAKTFADAVRKASSEDCAVILTKFLRIVKSSDGGYYDAIPNRFDGVDPGLKDVVDFGYINLTKDYRVIPQTLVVKDGTEVDSLSEAVVKAFRLPQAESDSEIDNSYCGALIERSGFVVHYADEIAKADQKRLGELRQEFAGKIVIIGGAWTQDAAADPNDKCTPVTTVDTQETPAGPMPAVFIHANWIESILAGRTGRPLSEFWRSAIEFVVGLFAFLLFRDWIPWLKGHHKALLLLQIAFFPLVVVFWILISYLGFQNFGLFIDPLLGLVGAFLALVDRFGTNVWEWYRDSHPGSDETARGVT